MSSLTLYLLVVCGNVGMATLIVALAGTVVLFFLGAAIGGDILDSNKLLQTYKKFTIFIAIMWAVTCLVPSQKEIAAIYIIPKVINNEDISKLPSNLAELANEWIKELKPKGGK